MYCVSAEGASGAWYETADAKPEHWDEAVKVATDRARVDQRNYAIRYVEGDSARIVATATPDDGIVFPMFYASPPAHRDRVMDEQTLWLYDLQRERERDAGKSALAGEGWVVIARGVLDDAPPWITDAAKREYLHCNGLR